MDGDGITSGISELSLDEEGREVDIFGNMIKLKSWNTNTWTTGSTSIPCTLCSSDMDCSFEYYGDSMHTVNIFVSTCNNIRCTRRKTRTTLQNLYCDRKYCKSNRNNMKCSFKMDNDGKLWICCTCMGCDISIVGSYACIHRDCHYPLILCDTMPFSQDPITTRLSYGCIKCFSDNQKRYKLTVHSIQGHEKEIMYDPTLSRDYSISCPKCLITGAVVSMEGEDRRTGRNDNVFSFRFYCINPKCHCYWKIEHL